MQRNVIEIVLGAVVLIVAFLFLLFAYSITRSTVEGYEVTAAFNDLGGIQTGDTVRISGVDVGQITDYQTRSRNLSSRRLIHHRPYYPITS